MKHLNKIVLTVWCLGAFGALSAQHELNFSAPDCPPASVGDVIDEESINVYPNPVRDEAVIEINGNNFSDLNVELYGLSGSLLETVSRTETGRMRIDMSKYQQGVYFIRVSEGNQVVRKKIVKL